MIPLINLSDPFSILVATVLFVLILFLARETKRKMVVGLLLVAFLVIIMGHTFEFFTLPDLPESTVTAVLRSIAMDFIFIFISFISYLWIDDVESKEKDIKSLNNSLDWFWKKV